MEIIGVITAITYFLGEDEKEKMIENETTGI